MNRETFAYDINNYYIDNGYIVINGWGITATDQQLTGTDTHEFSMTLTNGKTGKINTYVATLKNVDKTELMRMKTTYRQCGYYEIDQVPTTCYYPYTMAGFEFRIPLSDLEADTEYEIILRVWAKIVNRGYQLQIYAPSINKYYEINGVRYLLNSDMSKTYATVTGEPVYVRNGFDINSSRQTSWQYCSGSGYNLYWLLYHTYYNIAQVAQTNPGALDSETWLNIKFDQGVCSNGRSRAVNGTSYTGWIAGIYTDFSGTPATIKTYRVKNTSIDKIKAYTSETNTATKVVVNLYNSYNQTNNVKMYHNGNLVYNQNITYNGSKELTINYSIPNSGTVKIVVTEPNGLTTEFNSSIYVSSKKSYTMTSQTGSIVDSTPILVVTSKSGAVDKYYEHINYTVPYTYKEIVSGQGIEAWINIQYISDTSEIKLKSDVSGVVYFPTQEKTLNYGITNNKINVNSIKTISNTNQVVLNLPEYVLDKNKGYVYLKGKEPSGITTVYGDRKWYVPLADSLGSYNYEIMASNIGVNRISIKVPCSYKIIKKLIGNKDSKYIIKRTYIPKTLNYRFSKIYNYQDLIKLGGN